MMDKTGKVIYVGKAKKLKNRVSQYFQDSASHNEKTRAMVAQVDRFDTIFVSTEFEALILENSSSSATCRATTSCSRTTRAIPSCGCSRGWTIRAFSLVGRTADDGAKYFGPFGGRRETRLAIEAVCSALKLPTCSRQFPRDIGRERPCLNHHIGRCDGFCLPDGPSRAGVSGPHPTGRAHLQRSLPPADGGAADGDGASRRSAGVRTRGRPARPHPRHLRPRQDAAGHRGRLRRHGRVGRVPRRGALRVERAAHRGRQSPRPRGRRLPRSE